MDLTQLAGWVPIRLYWQDSRPMVDWCYLGTRQFHEPFFDETIDQCLRQPFNMLFRHQTPVEVLSELQDAQPGLPPNGFIFHMSRCGSTLIARMLAALPQNIVISEADPIDTVLRANHRDPRVTDDQRVVWLRGLVSALGRQRNPEQRNLFIKFDSWSVLDLPLVRRAFPATPWLFVYRDPVEVLVSHALQRGRQMLPGVLEPALLGLDPAEINPALLNEYCAKVLGCFCQAAVQNDWPDTARAVNYRGLPEEVWSSLAQFFGVCYTEEEVERMRAVTPYHAKQPRFMFAEDSAAKQQLASDEIRALAERFVRPWYDRLEALSNPIGVPHAEEL
ncbi:MAG TPA: hypothetical protein VK897_21000 [Anaerolineales bacterium]|nr:hypothetical protein [Anaerolineales bacterium]